MGQYVQRVPVKFKTGSVATATPVYLDTMSFPTPMTVTAIVGSGGSMLVEYSTTPEAATLKTGAVWFSWPSGTVNTNTSNALIAPIAGIRFTATTAAGTYEVVA